MGIKEDITKIYVGYYDRAPDPAGLNYWIGRANAGMTLSEIAASFAVQPESTAKYPYLANPLVASAESFIVSIYQNLFNRAPDDAGKAYWLGELAAGKAVGQMIIDIMSGAKDDAVSKDATILNNKVAVGVDFAEELSAIGGLDYENNPAAKTAAADALNGVTDDAATVDAAKTATDTIVASGELAPKGTFILTAGADAGADFTGGPGTDVFTATETTLSSADALDGGAGNDTLNYSSSGAAAVAEAGFTATNIENINVTADAVGGTTFDATGVTGAKKLTNTNSSGNLTVNGASEKVDLALTKVSANNTTLNYDAAVVAGAADEQNIALNGNQTSGGGAIGNVTVNGVETFNVSSMGAASMVNSLVGGSLTKMVVTGDKDLGIVTQSFAGTTNELDASAFTGNLNVTMGNTGAVDVVVKGGTGDDMADFSNGFDAGDSFDGGDGTDTLGLTTAVATGAPGGAVANVEKLNISDAGAGGALTVDMDNFAGINDVNFDGGLGGARTVGDAVTGIKVGVDAPAGQNLTVALKTDGTTDEVTVDFDELAAGSNVGILTANEAETLNISADDHTANSSGTLTIGSLSATDATTVNLSGDAMVTITGTADPATPILTTFDASAMTDGVSLSGTNFAAGGSVVKFGAGDDTYNVATSAGADTITLGGGKDKVVYTAVAQSSAAKVDTITDFVSGTDVVDVTALLGGAPTSANFVGVFANFGAAQGALTGGATPSAVFDSSTNTLWVDANGDGTLDSNDAQIILSGVTSVTAADLGLTGGVTFTANKAGFNTGTAADSTENNAVTNAGDTINATVAQINNGGTVINGLVGTDILNVSGPGTADLTMGAFSNTETVNLANDTDGLIVNRTSVDGTANDITTIAGNAGKNQTLTINPFGGTADLKITSVSNVENFVFGAAGEIRVDEDSFANLTTITGSVGADIFELNGNAATDDFDFTGRILTQVETLDLVMADDVTIGTAQLAGGVTAITGAAGADLFLTSSIDLTPLAIAAGAIDDITMTVNNTALTIDDTHDAGADFDDLIGQGSNDLIALTGAAGIVNIDTFTGFDTIDASGLADGQVLDIDDDATDTNYMINLGDSDLNMAGSTSTDQVTVNQSGAAPANQSVETGNGNDTLNLTAATALTVDANGGNDTINLGANLTTADTIDGGAGTDTINVTNDTATTDLDNVTNVEVINMTGANAFSYATVDANIAAGQSMTFNQSTGSGALTLDFALETDGSVVANAGSGGSTITMTSNNLVDTFVLGSGADALVIDANNTVANLANVDQVSNFNQSGNDSIDFTGGVATQVFTVNLATSSLASFVGDVNTALNNIVGYGAIDAVQDGIIVNIAGGALAGTYMISDQTAAAGIDATAEIVQLTGTIGAVTDADFI